jgi:hypothetical protein
LSNVRIIRLSRAASRQDIGISGGSCREPYPNNVVTSRFERRHGGARKILVRQKA